MSITIYPEPIAEPLDVVTPAGDTVDVSTPANQPIAVSGVSLLGEADSLGLAHEAARYTATQTSTLLVDPGTDVLVVQHVQIQVGGTTAGELQLYFGTGAFSRGTSRAIFDGEFAPSSTLKPGVILNGPFLAGAGGDDLRVTTSAAINPLTINVWYYTIAP